MNIVKPNLPVNLFIQPSSQSVFPVEIRQLELRLNQVVLASVIEGGMDKALLELNGQNYRAQSEKELLAGQQLKLQVKQLQPHLEFRVLEAVSSNRLITLLPLLTHPFNWSDLASRLQQHQTQSIPPQAYSNLFSQLQQLLSPVSDIEVLAETNIAKVITQWQQLTSSAFEPMAADGARIQIAPQHRAFSEFSSLVSSPVDKVMIDLVQKLQAQISLLRDSPRDMPVSSRWLEQTRGVLAPLQRDNLFLPNLPLTTRSLLIDTLTQLRLQPKVTPQLMADLEKILVRLKSEETIAPVPSEKMSRAGLKAQVDVASSHMLKIPPNISSDTLGARPANRSTEDSVLADNQKMLAGAVRQRRESMHIGGMSQVLAGPPDESAELAGTQRGNSRVDLSPLEGELKQLAGLVQQVQEQKTGLSPGLFGRLEGLLSRLQQSALNNSVAIPGFDHALGQLSQLLSQPPGVPQGGQLGLLSQLFGFYLEAELLQGKQKDALANLKQSLLSLQKELGEEVAEPLRRLELFQLCKARLGEDQVQFLPLPFSELEEGYLLAEQQENNSDTENKKGLNLSVSLRLSALGNVRIDMLYSAEHGLQMQIAGENLEKKRYLESCADELRQAVQTVTLNAVSFSADAQLPAKQLQRRLVPEMEGMLDARI